MEALLGSTLVNHAGEKLDTTKALAGAKLIAVYFSAHWCPPLEGLQNRRRICRCSPVPCNAMHDERRCRGFTPVLSKFFTENAEKLGLKIVFVSSDSDEAAFKAYFGEMSFGLALPYGSAQKDVVGGDVRGIPTLKIFDASGKLLTKEGRAAVTGYNGEKFP